MERNPTIEVNALNKNGETFIEILSQGPNDVKDQQTIRSQMHVGEVDKKKKKKGCIGHFKNKLWFVDNDKKKILSAEEKYQKDRDLENKRNTLMLVATFIGAMAFQSGTNPPGGVWQDTSKTGDEGQHHEAGQAIMVLNYEGLYIAFLVANAVGFVSAFSIVLLLISGLHSLMDRVFLGIITVIMWIATISMLIAYSVSIWALSPKPTPLAVRLIVICIIWVGGSVMYLISTGHITQIQNYYIRRRWGNLTPDVKNQGETEM